MSAEMSAEPVAWMTPGGDVSRSLEWCKERCWPQGERPTPLYSQSPAEARALAIAEAARVAMSLYNGSDHLPSYDEGWNDGIDAAEQAIRALSSPPSVSEEWVRERVEETFGKNNAFRAEVEGMREAVDEYALGDERYKYVRRLNVMEFAKLYQRNIKEGIPFDDLIDLARKESSNG